MSFVEATLRSEGERLSRRTIVGGLAAWGAIASGATARNAFAAHQATTSEPGATELYSIEISAEDLPAGDALVGIGRFELGPGASVTSPPHTQPPSVSIEYVLDGRYGVTSDLRLFVLRASGEGAPSATPTADPVTPGQEVELGPGDAVVFLDNDVSSQLARNLGERPVVGLAAGVFSTDTASVTAEWTVDGDYRFDFLAFAEAAKWATVPAGPVTLTLTHMAAQPNDDTLPADTLRIMGTAEGQDGVFVLTVSPAAGEA